MDLRSGLRRYGDAGAAAVLALILTTEAALWEQAEHAKVVPAALLATLPLALRRRSPILSPLLAGAGVVAVLYFSQGFDNNSLGVLCVFFLALYSLGRHTRGLDAGIGALLVLAATVAFILGDGPPIWTPGDVGFGLLFVGGPWAAGLAIRLRLEREQTLTARNVDLEADREERARQAVAAERGRIARELHDVVSHAISVSILQARGGRRMIGSDEASVRSAFDVIERTNTQALGDMRRLLALLRDGDGDGDGDTTPQPSLARLAALVDQVRSSGLPVQLSIHGATEQVPPGVELTAYRIVQEALTNALKHAGPAAEARVEVVCGDHDVDIAVEDSGIGHRNGAGPGRGLIGIRERVAVAGGRIETGAGDAGGFRIRARLPYAVQT